MLQNVQVDPQFYAFRWITLLLTQEFSFHTVLRIWDALLSHPFGIQVFLYFFLIDDPPAVSQKGSFSKTNTSLALSGHGFANLLCNAAVCENRTDEW